MSHSPLFARRAQRAGALTATAALALLAALALVPGRSGATFAGANGAIAFERYASGREDGRTAQIYVRGADGAVRRLTSLAGGAFDPAFSPDGATIAFDRRHERTHQPDELLAMNADGSGAHPLTVGCTRAARCLGDDVPSFSPDGRRVVFERIFGPIVRQRLPFKNRHHDHATVERASRVDLMVVDAAGGTPTLIRRWGLDPQPWEGAPRFSPDGRSVVLPLGTTREAGPSTAIGTALHVLDVGGGALRRITPWALGAGNPDWSPDGGRIAFNSEGGHTPHVEVVNADGSGLTQLPRGDSTFGWQPAWSPDGRQIAFSRSPESHPRGLPPMDIVVMNPDGTGVRALTTGGALDLLPVWAPTR